MKKLAIILALIAAVAGITYVVRPTQLQTPTTTPGGKLPGPIIFQDYVTYEGKSGKTALAILQDITTVETKQFDQGAFVESINGVKPPEGYFWKLFVNSQEAQVGADKLETKNGDIIEWKLEKIKK